MAAAGVPWAVVHSARVKAFRQVQGIKAKTDAIDARLLQCFGRDRLSAGKLRLGRAEDVTLDALMTRRRQLKAALHAEHCRLETAAVELGSRPRSSARSPSSSASLARSRPNSPSTKPMTRSSASRSKFCARAKASHVPPRDRCSPNCPSWVGSTVRRSVRWAGLAPRVYQSGRTERRRGLAPGRSAIKVILFNPARTAMRFDPEIVAFCARLRARGKPGKVIMVAVMRKLLVRLNAALRDALNGVCVPVQQPCAWSERFDHGGRNRHRAQAVKGGAAAAAAVSLDGRARCRTIGRLIEAK